MIEVFADVGCPFTHVGLRRLVERRDELGRDDVRIRVRAWPLEVVNGRPLTGAFVAEEVVELRAQVAPDLFGGFDPAAFGSTLLPAMALGALAYEADDLVGEQVSLALRDALFEHGSNVSDPKVLEKIARDHGVGLDLDLARVHDEHAEGVRRGVVGSPHFFTAGGSFFCPALDISHDPSGRLLVRPDPAAFEAFIEAAFG